MQVPGETFALTEAPEQSCNLSAQLDLLMLFNDIRCSGHIFGLYGMLNRFLDQALVLESLAGPPDKCGFS